jgi:hypothetical protein
MREVTVQEYYQKTRVPYADVRRMSAGRCYDEFVSLCGTEIGSKHQVMNASGKVTSETYYLNDKA